MESPVFMCKKCRQPLKMLKVEVGTFLFGEGDIAEIWGCDLHGKSGIVIVAAKPGAESRPELIPALAAHVRSHGIHLGEVWPRDEYGRKQ